MNKLTTLFLHCAKHLITPYHLIIRTTYVGTTIHLMLQTRKTKDREGKSLYTTSQSPQVAEMRYKLRESCSWAIKLDKNHLLNLGETEWGDGVMGGFIRQTNSQQVHIGRATNAE